MCFKRKNTVGLSTSTLRIASCSILTATLIILFLSNYVQAPFETNGTEECTSVIVTGTAAKDGRAILMKNRDTGDATNRPVYYPSNADGTYAYVMVNSSSLELYIV